MFGFLEGFVKYPDTLPCPQVDTDLVPRERRYLSDITDVRNMRMFQQEFQATRNRISFVFTEEEAREFRDWYENEIIHGGAWFYADWPTLHKDKKIAHRFVGQPKYEWLFGANPGTMGRSFVGNGGDKAVSPVTMYKVTATVELYERKVGKTANVFTSKLYPLLPVDDVKISVPTYRTNPTYSMDDHALLSVPQFSGVITGIVDINLRVDDKNIPHYLLFGQHDEKWYDQHFEFSAQLFGSATKYIYGEYRFSDDANVTIPLFTGVIAKLLITYEYYNEDTATITIPSITSGQLS